MISHRISLETMPPLDFLTIDQCVQNELSRLKAKPKVLSNERCVSCSTTLLWPQQVFSGRTNFEPATHDDRIENQLMSNVENTTFHTLIRKRLKPKSIFLTKAGAWWGPTVTAQQRLALFKHCPINYCEVTEQQTEKDNNSSWDAVITPELHLLPIAKEGGILVRPASTRHQQWIYYGIESPYYEYNKLSSPQNSPFLAFINWTATYRTDSDIVVPYGKWISYRQNSRPALTGTLESLRNVWRNKLDNRHVYALALISHCVASGRLSIVSQLRAAGIQVDLFGACGNKSKIGNLDNYQKLMKLARMKYHFYLALENSRCVGYITEKFFSSGLSAGMIPVVRGGKLYTLAT